VVLCKKYPEFADHRLEYLQEKVNSFFSAAKNAFFIYIIFFIVSRNAYSGLIALKITKGYEILTWEFTNHI
jgi:hypothetical protein